MSTILPLPVHRLAPPLPAVPHHPSPHRPARIAVVGGGLSGVLTAIHLLWRCRKGERIYLVERGDRLGPGLAYSASNAQHVLNVRAANASAFGDEPDHFCRWLRRLPAAEREGAGLATDAGFFARRSVYGTYIQQLLHDAILRQGGAANLFIIADECVALRQQAEDIELVTAMGRTHTIDAAVLATGVAPPDTKDGPGYIANPWDHRAVEGLNPDQPVLLVGTGLTMVDVCLALWADGFKGTVHAISRRGLLPRPHANAPVWSGLRLRLSERVSLVSLTRAVRREVERAASQGVDWRSVVDALRPRLSTLWEGLSTTEQARFLRHLRPWWDVHRHRLAPSVHASIEAQMAAGKLQVAAGKVEAISWNGRAAEVSWRPRRSDGMRRLEVQRVINCTGLGADVAESEQPLLRQLLADGLASADPHRLGLAATHSGTLLDASGSPADRLFAVGPLTRGVFWETTSVPDIRNQAETVAVNVLRAARRAALRHTRRSAA